MVLDPLKRERKRREWPEVSPPEPMTVDELEAVRYQLGAIYGRPMDPVPASVLAPALGRNERQLYRWFNGEVAVPLLVAKQLRQFVAAESIY